MRLIKGLAFQPASLFALVLLLCPRPASASNFGCSAEWIVVFSVLISAPIMLILRLVLRSYYELRLQLAVIIGIPSATAALFARCEHGYDSPSNVISALFVLFAALVLGSPRFCARPKL